MPEPASIPFPAVIIPYVGPFLIVLLLVKAFYWKRGDFWFMQGIGLAFVVLGCILASGALFLKEKMNGIQIAGIATILVGIVLVTLSSSSASVAPLRH